MLIIPDYILHNMPLSRQQRNELWGEDGPYSQVGLTTETRILNDSVSRIFLVAEVNINPLTYKLIKQHRQLFADDLEIQGIIDHAEFQGQADGFVTCIFHEQYIDLRSYTRAQERVEICKTAVIKMHSFVMQNLKITGHEASGNRGVAPMNMTPRRIMTIYLQEQSKSISDSLFKVREEAIGLFEDHGDNYAHLFADDEDDAATANLSDDQWCDSVATDSLSYELFSHFVGYFLPRKVMAGNDGLRRLARSIIHFYLWCCEKGFIQDEHPNETAKSLRNELTEALNSQSTDED